MVPKKEENLSKEKLLAEIERLKKELKKRKKYGLVWEEKPEDVVEMCKKSLPVLKELKIQFMIGESYEKERGVVKKNQYQS